MEYGFVKTAAVSPKIRVADPVYNGNLGKRRPYHRISRTVHHWLYMQRSVSSGAPAEDSKRSADGDRGSQRRNGWSVLCRTSPGESRKAL